MKRVPWVSVILEDMDGEVLLLLRDNKSTIVFPNHWTLIGGKIAEGETPEMAAHRMLEEETGLKTKLSLWKQYDREHPLFMIDQHIFTGREADSRNLLILSRGVQFFKPCEVVHLHIGYGFKDLLNEYFLIKER